MREDCVAEIRGSTDVMISAIAYDSRKVVPGSVFFAIKGERSDGHDYVQAAIENGASVIVYDSNINEKISGEVVFVKVANSREALASVSALFYGEPSKALKTIGITGTNGKTTSSYLIKSVFDKAGLKSGLIGTIGYLTGKSSYDAAHTTPESPEFQSLLRQMADDGCSHVVAEISSHALSQNRVDNTAFDVVVFTNLTRDHLDYHGDIESYYRAKRRLFWDIADAHCSAVINIDDEYGRRLISDILEADKGVKEIITYGKSAEADLKAVNIGHSMLDIGFDIHYNGELYHFAPKIKGAVNIYNIMAAFGVAITLGIGTDDIVAGITGLENVRGRFENIECNQGFSVIVDYAHTDDALRSVLSNIRNTKNGKADRSGRIITVFGCGGNRDRGKRALMGKVAGELSDFTIITTDNPRFEDPAAIIDDIEAGITGDYSIIRDREEAIREAVRMAYAGDVVLIAGKGHEDYQEINGKRLHFDDREVVEKCLPAGIVSMS